MLDMKTRLIENMEIMYTAIRFPHSKEIALWKRVSAFLHLLRVPTRVATQGIPESQENAKRVQSNNAALQEEAAFYGSINSGCEPDHMGSIQKHGFLRIRV